MCDYSLMEYASRLAVEGEMLVVRRFRSGSLGLASPEPRNTPEPNPALKRSFWQVLKEIFAAPEVPCITAVCIPPGARLILHDMPERAQKDLDIGPIEPVTFVQTSANVNQHRDAVRFRTGCVVRLQDLEEGQRVKVIDLGYDEVEEPESSGVYIGKSPTTWLNR